MEDNIDSNFCHFCQDALPSGTMLVLSNRTYEVLWRSDVKVCKRCGLAHDSQILAVNNDSEECAVFQFEHFEFDEERLSGQIAALETVFKSLACHVCGKPVNWGADSYGYPPRVFAVRMLRMDPEVDSVDATCETCASLGLCPHCDENGDHFE